MKILMVSPCFAPDLQVGALRMSSLAAFLCAKGDQVTVLRNLRPENPPYQPPAGMTVIPVDLQDIYPTVPGAEKTKRHFLERAAAEKYLLAARKTMAAERFDGMLISMGPFYTQALCAMAKKEFGVPCVLDFRDPGALDRRKQTGLKKQLWNKFYRARLFLREKKAVNAAALVVTVVPGWAKMMKNAYHLPEGKTPVIANGYDDEKLRALSLQRSEEKPGKGALRIACFGKLTYYSAAYAEKFFAAAASLIREGYEITVVQLGQREGDVTGILSRAGFPAERYENIPFCPYAEGMQRLAQAHVLLAIDERPDAMATKIYDYIYVNRPLLFMGPRETEQARLALKLPGGYAAASVQEAMDALIRICESEQTLLLPEEQIADYGRAAQNAKYRALMQAAAKKTPN